jgi:hypothetical protein
MSRSFPVANSIRIFPTAGNRIFPNPGDETSGGEEPETDPHWSSVVLLCGFDGADGSTSFDDESLSNRTLTANGNAQVDTAESKFGGSSLLLDGTGDWVSAASSTDLSVANSDDITIEAFIMISATGRLHTITNKRDGSGAEEHSFQINTSNLLIFSAFSAGSAVVSLTGTTALTTGVWYHAAVTRQGTTWRLFLDGNLEDSDTQSGTPSSNAATFNIGRDGFNTSRDFQGWIDEFRFTKGVARYTGNFTPPSEEFPRS